MTILISTTDFSHFCLYIRCCFGTSFYIKPKLVDKKIRDTNCSQVDNEIVKASIHFLHVDYYTIDHIYFIVRTVGGVNAVMVLAVLLLMVYFFKSIKMYLDCHQILGS